MVNKREKPNYKRHLIILSLTIFVFLIGTFIGSQMDDVRINDLSVRFEEDNNHLQQVITGEKFISYLIDNDELNNNSCAMIEDLYWFNIDLLGQTREKLELYTKESDYRKEDFMAIRKSFTEQQINFWILANKVQKSCDSSFKTILYFYSNEANCENCNDQGIYLSYVKKKMTDDLFVFAMNLDLDTSATMLKKYYGVDDNEYPTLIINDKKYGFLTKDEIFEALNVSVE